MAANSPIAVANSASRDAGAPPTASEVFFEAAIEVNAVMMPHTVPNSPTYGPADPIDARNTRRESSRSTSRWMVTSSTLSMRADRLAICRPDPSNERFHSRIAATKHRREAGCRLVLQRAVQLLERLARPERILELVHGGFGAPEQHRLVDDDRPAPHGRAEQAEHHDLGRPATRSRKGPTARSRRSGTVPMTSAGFIRDMSSWRGGGDEPGPPRSRQSESGSFARHL